MKLLQNIKEYFNKLKTEKEYKKRHDKVLKECGNVCYCFNCKEILNDKSTCIKLDESIYEYECSKCKSVSIFNFDIAPVPILIKKGDK